MSLYYVTFSNRCLFVIVARRVIKIPLLQIIKPPTEKVSVGETHRIEDEHTIRVYHFVDNEWRLEPKRSFPKILTINSEEMVQCQQPPVKETFDPSLELPRPPGTKAVSVSDLRHIPLDTIHQCAKLSDLAYSHYQDLLNDRSGSDLLGATASEFPILINHAVGEMGCCYLWKSKYERTIFLSIRGPPRMSDIINPLVGFGFASEGCGKVNMAYLDWCSSIIPFVHEKLVNVRNQFDHVVCTGHSLGAGCATIMAPVIANLLVSTRVSCITFGSPRVGDQEFGNWFRRKMHFSYRVITRGDPVSIIPMSGECIHVADALAVGPNGEAENWKEDIDADLWNFSWHEIMHYLRSSRLHCVGAYIDRVKKMVDEFSLHTRSTGL